MRSVTRPRLRRGTTPCTTGWSHCRRSSRAKEGSDECPTASGGNQPALHTHTLRLIGIRTSSLSVLRAPSTWRHAQHCQLSHATGTPGVYIAQSPRSLGTPAGTAGLASVIGATSPGGGVRRTLRVHWRGGVRRFGRRRATIGQCRGGGRGWWRLAGREDLQSLRRARAEPEPRKHATPALRGGARACASGVCVLSGRWCCRVFGTGNREQGTGLAHAEEVSRCSKGRGRKGWHLPWAASVHRMPRKPQPHRSRSSTVLRRAA